VTAISSFSVIIAIITNISSIGDSAAGNIYPLVVRAAAATLYWRKKEAPNRKLRWKQLLHLQRRLLLVLGRMDERTSCQLTRNISFCTSTCRYSLKHSANLVD